MGRVIDIEIDPIEQEEHIELDDQGNMKLKLIMKELSKKEDDNGQTHS
jgi:hypothetical protein